MIENKLNKNLIKMNKKGQSKIAIVLVMIILIIAVIFIINKEQIPEKQMPHPANLTSGDPGTLYVRMRDTEGNEGEMLPDFYIIGGTIKGTNSIACTTDTPCINACGIDKFCLNNIKCVESKCTYTNIASITIENPKTNNKNWIVIIGGILVALYLLKKNKNS